MILVNKVFTLPGNRRIRVLHDEADRNLVWVYYLDEEKGQPISMLRQDLYDLISSGKATETEDNWAYKSITAEDISDAEREHIDRLWQAIKPLLSDMPRILIREHRGKLIAEVAKTSGISKPTLRKGFRRCCLRGLIKSALLPDFRNCGARGKRRKSNKMLGRPRYDGQVGVKITDPLIKWMNKFWKKSYLSNSKGALRSAHARFKSDFVNKLNNLKGDDISEFVRKYGQTIVPSFAQFKYWFHVHFDPIQVLKARKGTRYYNGHVRPIFSNARNEVRGIGFRYVLDATTADCYILSRLDRNRIIGRPTVYLIVDVATRLIVGFYVGLEPPSYEAAMLAFLNIFEDKVALCERYGIKNLPREMWPSAPTCCSLLSDGGEMIGIAADRLVGVLFDDLETAASYRGDAKSVTERSFGITQTSFGPFTPGYVEKPGYTRGERDPRLDAAYTLEAFVKAIILEIIRVNNVPRRDFDGDPAVIEAGTPNIPSQLWKYYESQRLVDAPMLDYNFVARAVLHRKNVNVVRRGVRFSEGLYYNSDELITQPWFEPMILVKGELQAAYDSSDMSKIEVWSPLDPTQTFVCQLTPHSARFSGCSLSEVQALRRRERTNIQDFHRGENAQGFDPEAVEAFIAGKQDALKKEQIAARKKEMDPNLSNRKRTADIKKNRQEELRLEQKARSGAPIDGVSTLVHESEMTDSSEIDDVVSSLLDKLLVSINRKNSNEN